MGNSKVGITKRDCSAPIDKVTAPVALYDYQTPGNLLYVKIKNMRLSHEGTRQRWDSQGARGQELVYVILWDML